MAIMKIYKIYDETAETHTHIIIENAMTLVRNYVVNYKHEHLNHIATQISIIEQAIITETGDIIINERAKNTEKTLAKLLEDYDTYMEVQHADKEMA